MHIVEPGKTTRIRLYRARLLNFSPREAQTACALLHKKKLACSVVLPDDAQSRRSLANPGRSKPAKSRVIRLKRSGNATPLTAS